MQTQYSLEMEKLQMEQIEMLARKEGLRARMRAFQNLVREDILIEFTWVEINNSPWLKACFED